jgi:lipopolysaccharide/colanic/teichoic acid biosynthesis glycosyltransferase
VTLAAVSPFVALYLRNVDLVSAGGMPVADGFALVSFVASLTAFRIFRVSSTIPRYISVGDLLNLARAVITGGLITAFILFTVTRLDGIPRSLPAVHALILMTGLLISRALASAFDRNRRRADWPRDTSAENVILIGLNDWSALLIKFLQSASPRWWRVIALLDKEPRWFGRSVNGVQIFGPPAHLEPLVEEFAAHGVRVDRVVVGAETSELSNVELVNLEGVCKRLNMDFVFAPHLLGHQLNKSSGHCAHQDLGFRLDSSLPVDLSSSRYFRLKRVFDIVGSLILILLVLPLLVLSTLLVFIDVGSPVLFWQLRSGLNGRELQLYKLRTLQAPFDQTGERIPEEQRLSWIGRLLRQTRIDELPQLLNVLVGDMSLIGPRPLLPRDQPPSSALRLAVRPGITGWAQVNGGTSLSPMEKEALDVWYIRNVSLWLDLRIVGMTLLTLVRGERRSDEALAQARYLQAAE